MKTLIFQVVLKQWDKSQRTDAHLALRGAIENQYSIASSPQFIVLDAQCILDQYAVNFSDDSKLISGNHAGRVLKKSMLANGAIKLDKLIVSKAKGDNPSLCLQFEEDNGALKDVGILNNNWAQVTYQWRYSVEKDNQIFWLYEDVTVNVAFVDTLKADYFLKHAPSIRFNAGKT